MFSLNPFAKQKQLSSIARRYAWSVPVVIVLGIINGALEGVGIGLLIPMLGSLLMPEGGAQGGIIGLLSRFGQGLDETARLFLVAGTMLALMVFKNLLQGLSRIFIVFVDGKASDDIRRALASRLLTVGYLFHLSQDPARLVNIVATESWRASNAIRAAFVQIASFAAASIFVLMLFLVSWQLTLIVIAGALLVRFVQIAFDRRLETRSARVSQSNRDLTDRMLASVYQARLIRLFGCSASEQARFDAASDKVRRSMLVVERVSSFAWPLQEVLYTAIFLGIFLIATFAGVTLPVLAAFLVLLNRLQPHLRSLEAASTERASLATQVAEVEWLLDPEGKPLAPTGTLPFRGLCHQIEFLDVSFVYPTRAGMPALRNANFTIRAGRATALIGRSGSGKSTIINLLCRLLEPSSGTILADGTNIAMMDPARWLDGIGIAGQDIDLIEGTIADNIAFGRPGLTEAEIVKAARDADAHEFIMGLPEGYDTMVGTRGHSLSGGQRQRIGIARAIARKPSILILDEATNAVDGLSEAAILQLLQRSAEKRTIIVVSHRVSTLALCEDAIVVEDGVITEHGHIAATEAYRRMATVGADLRP